MQQDPVVTPEHPAPELPGTPRVVPRGGHIISRKNIDPDALKVMGRLIRYGYQAFLVGGGVRDLLLGKTPKDYDISTDARPEEIRRLFRNSRIIGRRFRLIHVFFVGNKIFEVSTFRQDSDPDGEREIEIEDVTPQKSDNVYGDPLTDAFRRDLTINGLFYDLRTRSVIDYVGGLEDLESRTIRMIGEPEVRFREDPVRMIRAVRHAARTGFEIESQTEDAIKRCGSIISSSSSARVYDELLRELQGGHALASFQLLYKLGLLGILLPAIAERIDRDGGTAEVFETLARLDALNKRNQNISPGVIFAGLLVTGLSESYLESLAGEYADESEEELPEAEARHRMEKLSGDMVNQILVPLGVPRRDREIAQILLFARSVCISELIARKAEDGDPAKRRRALSRSMLPELLPALCEVTGEARLFRPFFRSAEFERTPEPRPRRRRRRRRPGGPGEAR